MRLPARCLAESSGRSRDGWPDRSEARVPATSRRAIQAAFPTAGPGGDGGGCPRAVAAALLGTVIGGVVYLRPPSQSLIVASVPYWNIGYGTASVLSNPRTFSEMSPWMYGLDSSGRIVPQYAPAQAAMVNAQLARLRADRIPLVPTLANVVQGQWVYRPLITDILHNPQVRARHVAAIVALVQRQGYAGIDIDYEDLLASDRSAFTAFITQLADALHAKGKVLSVDLFAKPTSRGYDQRNLAQDYQAIGQVADQVRLMGYDYHWAGSGARADRADRLDPLRAQLRQDPDPGRQDHPWRAAVRLRLGGGRGTPAELAAGLPAVRAVRGTAALQRRQPVTVVRLYRRIRPPHVVWFENGRVRRRSSRRRKAPGSAACTFGCTARGHQHLDRAAAEPAPPPTRGQHLAARDMMS